MSQRRFSPAGRFIYVIGGETGAQKIGIATDPKSRLAALQTASPVRLMIHASVAVPFGAAHDIERYAHETLRLVRAAGEWFNTTPGEAVAAVKVAANRAPPHGFEGSSSVLPLFAFAEFPRPGKVGDIPTSLRPTWGLSRLWEAALPDKARQPPFRLRSVHNLGRLWRAALRVAVE